MVKSRGRRDLEASGEACEDWKRRHVGRFWSEKAMAHTLAPYLEVIRHSLNAALCLQSYPSQLVERQNRPEIEPRRLLGL